MMEVFACILLVYSMLVTHLLVRTRAALRSSREIADHAVRGLNFVAEERAKRFRNEQN